MHGDRALATVKILKNSVFLYTLLNPWGIKESERIILIFNTVHMYTQYLLLVGLNKNKINFVKERVTQDYLNEKTGIFACFIVRNSVRPCQLSNITHIGPIYLPLILPTFP